MLWGDRLAALAAAVAALGDLQTVLFACPTGDLAGLAGDLAELRAVCGAQLAAVVAEAETRGVIDASQAGSTAGWVADVAWHSRREATTIAKAARVLRRPDLPAVTHALHDLDVDPASAVAVAAEYDTLAPDLLDEAKPVVLEEFLAVAAAHGPSAVRRLKQEILARYGEDGDLDEHQHRCRRQIELTPGVQTSSGVWDYRLTVDDEGRAVLEAVIGPLSAPQPDPVSGAADVRPVGRRRGEALITALSRSVTAAAQVPTSPKAVLTLTMDYADLAAGVGAATVLGSRAAGTLLAPHTIRKLACDAAILPAVLGGDGEVLDLGRTQRLFSTGQIRALWLRDRHCTMPACTVPAAFCDAHHLTPWIDGGTTDLNNAALLCPRHHTIAHRDRLAGAVTAKGVTWDMRHGSHQPPGQPANAPAPPTEPDPPGDRPQGRNRRRALLRRGDLRTGGVGPFSATPGSARPTTTIQRTGTKPNATNRLETKDLAT
jgi:hypothetical protein